MGEAVKYPEREPHTEGTGESAIIRAIDSLRDEIGQRHVENTSVNEEQSRKLDEVIRRVDDLHKAFPGGDWDGHRRYHESLITKAEARTKFYLDLRSDLAKKGLWVVILAVGATALRYAQTHIRIFY